VLPEQGCMGAMLGLPTLPEGTVTWHGIPTCHYRDAFEQSTEESPLCSGTALLRDGNATGNKRSIKKKFK